MRLRVCLLTEIKRYKSAIRIRIRERMLNYMSDLFKDATDFSWTSVKTAHAMLLCKMERSTVTWADTELIG